ncbi:Rieske 2Fe-2S domain-containing protein [Streptomyces sp. NPDC049585]|uniref:Rieske 2Fe-2S domain-containing protein n=1 Tax=Streptomyces sp. NPDC049585 TaxID=3155154 RepID=UPI00342BBFA5
MRTFTSGYEARATTGPALPHPTGWFCVGFSGEWAPGDVRTRPFMGGEAVVYRSRSGALRATRPHCPHLGAHLGAGGTVEGDLLVCPFHGFAFALDGRCARTPYGKPPKASLDLLPVREDHGIVWLWHSAGNTPPTWEIPAFPAVARPRSFLGVDAAGHPQDVAENLLDYGHTCVLHRLDSMEVVQEPRSDGPFISLTYRVGRSLPLLPPAVQEATFHLVGLGGTLILFHASRLPVRAAQWLLATPTSTGRMRVWTAANVIATGGRLPAPLHRAVEGALSSVVNRWTRHDLNDDLRMWHHKTYLPHPRLNDGDGPIGAYRHWARQFYPG